MFCGIIEELGFVQRVDWIEKEGISLTIQAERILDGVKLGDSISVNGCCLTLTQFNKNSWGCHVVSETLRRTSLKNLQIDDRVNLERAMCLNGRIGGHLVQGHIDDVGVIVKKEKLEDSSFFITIQTSTSILNQMVYKGSVAVDGVSLTIAEISDAHFSFAMIPHTANVTTLGLKGIGQQVNLEVDLMAKYAKKLMLPYLESYARGAI